MTKQEIDKLCREGRFPENTIQPELVETHISWVVLCNKFAYKIKKPVHYSFLDFSTLEKRKYYCEREIELNRRLTENIYIGVQPIKQAAGKMYIGEGEGDLIDYAVQMRKIDRTRQMDILLEKNKVIDTDIEKLAKKIAAFHRHAEVIYNKDVMDIPVKFEDLAAEKEFLNQHLEIDSSGIIDRAMTTSGNFTRSNRQHLADRIKDGFTRDCHGDLHSRNIFLLEDPQPFDCIEFSDDIRQIDVLNEIAFLCMDLDAYERHDLSDLFLRRYNHFFPSMQIRLDEMLFIYYKSYRANIRAKVNSLRARSAENGPAKSRALAEAGKYLNMMNRYIDEL